jgi:hypothetical protein
MNSTPASLPDLRRGDPLPQGPSIVVDHVDNPSMNPRDSYEEREARSFMASKPGTSSANSAAALEGRPVRQGHPRPSNPRNRRMKNAHCLRVSMSGLFRISALYHRGNSTAAWRRRFSPHDGLFLIVGTATPACLLTERGTSGRGQPDRDDGRPQPATILACRPDELQGMQ